MCARGVSSSSNGFSLPDICRNHGGRVRLPATMIQLDYFLICQVNLTQILRSPSWVNTTMLLFLSILTTRVIEDFYVIGCPVFEVCGEPLIAYRFLKYRLKNDDVSRRRLRSLPSHFWRIRLGMVKAMRM